MIYSSCKFKISAVFCCFLFPLFVSCAAQINGSLAADSSAAFSVKTSLEPRMTSLIRMIAAAGGQSGGNILDGPLIAGSMSKAGTSVTLKNTGPAAVEGSVTILKINEFLSSAGAGQNIPESFIIFEQRGNDVPRSGGRCQISVNRGNGPMIMQTLSPEIFDYLNALMAPIATGETMNKIEYLSLVSSIYSKAISDEISGSRIRVSIEFPGQITNVKGGTFSGRRAEFNVPLLDLLVLEIPLVYEVVWN